MLLKTLYIDNFKSFKKPVEFSFERETGLHFLTGRNEVEPELGANGAGKSSLLDALVWVLYGKTARGVKAVNVRNWDSMKPCRVKCDFAIDGIGHEIERIWGPNSLKLDGQIVEQDVIDALINLTPEEFNYSIFASQFGQMFFDLSPTEKLAVFTDIMALEAWTERSAKASRKAKVVDTEIRDSQNLLAQIEGTLSALEEEVVRNQATSKGYEEEKSKRIQVLREEINELDQKADLVIAKLDPLEKEKELTPEPKIQPIDKWKSQADKAAEKLDATDDEINEYVFKLKSLNEEFDKFDGVSNICPHCKQKVSESHIDFELARLNTETAIMKGNKKKLEKTCGTMVKKYDTLYTKIADAEHAEDEYKQRQQERDQAIKALEYQLSVSEHEIEKQSDRIYDEEQKSNPFTKIIGEAKARKMRVTKDQISRKKDIAYLMQELEGMQFWAKGFKEIRLFLVEEALTQLEVEINNNLLQLGLRDWSIKLDVERETAAGGVAKGFHVTVQSPYNPKPVPWAVWSGGESQRLRLAGTMGLSDLILARKGIECNIEIYDEPTAHLSPSGVEDLLDSLYHRAIDRQKQIWLVDHNSLDFGSFASTTTIIKDKDGSHIG